MTVREFVTGGRQRSTSLWLLWMFVFCAAVPCVAVQPAPAYSQDAYDDDWWDWWDWDEDSGESYSEEDEWYEDDGDGYFGDYSDEDVGAFGYETYDYGYEFDYDYGYDDYDYGYGDYYDDYVYDRYDDGWIDNYYTDDWYESETDFNEWYDEL